ncbi:MAG: lipoate--protein ligase family protein [Planctomycetes bacterium]|nr:lipoate--protein ligase family protein [Planctomycetota bacterium]
MRILDLTLPTPAENLALDEALLDDAEAGGPSVGGVLRFWESPEPIVVVGRASRVRDEVDVEACRARSIPVLRRASGGAAIVAGPGCLMYAAVLAFERVPELAGRDLDQAHALALARLTAAASLQLPNVARQGISDVAWGDSKISGNSLRCKRTHLLYHGTLLYAFDLSLAPRVLRAAPRQPEYRRGRDHGAFIANAPLDPDRLRADLAEAWGTDSRLETWPIDRTARLVRERYGLATWHERL